MRQNIFLPLCCVAHCTCTLEFIPTLNDLNILNWIKTVLLPFELSCQQFYRHFFCLFSVWRKCFLFFFCFWAAGDFSFSTTGGHWENVSKLVRFSLVFLYTMFLPGLFQPKYLKNAVCAAEQWLCMHGSSTWRIQLNRLSNPEWQKLLYSTQKSSIYVQNVFCHMHIICLTSYANKTLCNHVYGVSSLIHPWIFSLYSFKLPWCFSFYTLSSGIGLYGLVDSKILSKCSESLCKIICISW